MDISVSKIEEKQREIPENWGIWGWEDSPGGREDNNSVKLPYLHFHILWLSTVPWNINWYRENEEEFLL